MFILHKANCTYCGGETRLARIPTLLIIVGILINATSIYSLVNGGELLSSTNEIYALGVGLGCFVFGVMFLRFVGAKTKKSKTHKSATHMTYSN